MKTNLKDKNSYYMFRVVSYSPSVYEKIDLMIRKYHLNKYAYILHDSDNTDNHYHILLTFSVRKRLLQVYSYLFDLDDEQNVFIEPTNKNEIYGDYLYLIHDNCPSKYQYDSSLIISNDIDYFEKYGDIKNKELDNLSFIEDLLNEEYTAFDLAKKYGRDFIKNYDKYVAFRNVIKNDELNRALSKSSVPQGLNS